MPPTHPSQVRPMKRELTFSVIGLIVGILLTSTTYPLFAQIYGSTPTPTAPPPSISASHDDLELTLRLDRADYKPGDKLNATIRLANKSPNQEITAMFTSSKKFDLKALDAEGKLIFTWSEGRFFTQVITKATLQPGEILEQTLTWRIDPELREGTYKLVGLSDIAGIDGGGGAHLETPTLQINISP